MAFADLLSDVEGAFKNLTGLFGGDSDLPYPKEFGVVTNVIQDNDKSWRKSVGYGFNVVRVANSGAPKPADGWKEFILQINPESLTQDEIFAIQVTPTFTGVLVEHQGVTLKDIQIAGTTGISPNRSGMSGAYPQSGRPVAGEGRSGYTEFHELRNYIRAYVEAKRNDKNSKNGELRLIWNNFKDHESIYVEPQKFQMRRSARRPFMYDYNIALKGIGLATEQAKAGSWLDSIDNVIEDIIGVLDAGGKILQGGSDFITKVDQEFVSTTLAFVNTIATAMKAGGDLSKNFKNAKSKESINRFSMERLRDKLDATADNTYDILLGDDVASYNQAKGRTATLKGGGFTYDELKVAAALKKLKKTIKKLLAMNKDIWSTTDAENANRAKNIANDTYGQAKLSQARSASLVELKKLQSDVAKKKASGDIVAQQKAQDDLDDLLESITSSVGKEATSQVIDTSSVTTEEITLPGNMTIQSLSAFILGDVQRFKELIIINNLKYPYVEIEAPTFPDGSVDESQKLPGVLYPGDKIKIPTSGSSKNPSGVQHTGKLAPITELLTPAELNFGVDFQLTDSFDIEIDVNGDAKLIASTRNVAQAIILKLLMETGALKPHPEIGTDLSIGQKAVNVSIIAEQVRRSLLSDSRIESVIFVEVIQESSAILINMILKLKDVDQELAIPVKIPNAA